MTTTPTFIKDHAGNPAQLIEVDGIWCRYASLCGSDMGRTFSGRYYPNRIITDPVAIEAAMVSWQRATAV